MEGYRRLRLSTRVVCSVLGSSVYVPNCAPFRRKIRRREERKRRRRIRERRRKRMEVPRRRLERVERRLLPSIFHSRHNLFIRL